MQEHGHKLFLNCRDCHLICIECGNYLYPRELSGVEDDAPESRMCTGLAEEWLQVLGRSRGWWRRCEGDTVGSPGVRGIKNYGNTCFFTSVCQVAVHLPAIQEAAARAPVPDRGSIEAGLRLLHRQYWDKHSKQDTLDPRPLWEALKEHALFGM